MTISDLQNGMQFSFEELLYQPVLTNSNQTLEGILELKTQEYFPVYTKAKATTGITVLAQESKRFIAFDKMIPLVADLQLNLTEGVFVLGTEIVAVFSSWMNKIIQVKKPWKKDQFCFPEKYSSYTILDELTDLFSLQLWTNRGMKPVGGVQLLHQVQEDGSFSQEFNSDDVTGYIKYTFKNDQLEIFQYSIETSLTDFDDVSFINGLLIHVGKKIFIRENANIWA